MGSTDNLERAFASTAKVLANVSASQFDDPTPCASWDVRALVNHIVGSTTFFAVAAETGVAPTESAPDATGGDVVGTFEAGAARAVRAFGAEGAMEKVMRLPFGELPGAVFVNIAATDAFTHGWDLARATGQSTDLDPELAEQFLAGAKIAIPESFRGPDGQAPFGPVVEAPDSAPAADRLAAFLGRSL